MRLEPGDKAPAFCLRDDDGRERELSDLLGSKLVIYFYPRAFTPGCTTESCDFRDKYEVFQGAGYEIIGISPDPPEKLADFRREHSLPFPLLSDPDHVTSEAYGAWGTKKNYGREYQGILRTTIVLDARGRVTHAWYNVRAKGHAGRVESEVIG